MHEQSQTILSLPILKLKIFIHKNQPKFPKSFFRLETFLRLGHNETGYEMLVGLRSNGPVRPLNAWQGTKSLTNQRTTNILYPMLANVSFINFYC